MCTVRATSRVWETAPVGGPAQPRFLNAALLVDAAPTRTFLARLQAVEADLGRVRVAGVRNAPRSIDIDVLWAGTTISTDPQLTIPHPRLTERAFALLPLLDVVPDARDPITGRVYVAPPGDVVVSAHRL